MTTTETQQEPEASSEEEGKTWEWVKDVEPRELTEGHILQTYHLDTQRFPREMPEGPRGAVARNPYWIKRMGEKRWLDMDNDTLVAEDHPDYSSRVLGIRQSSEFVGLTNCGSTCFVNSIFQIWFHNPLLREPIMSWVPPLLNHVSCPLIELRKLFIRMRYSNRKSIDTADLIKSLKLEEHVQQDAQEFALLFSEKMIATLEEYNERELKLLFDTLCQGELQYQICCSTCNSCTTKTEAFTELKVGLFGSFNDAIEILLLPEELLGDNKYACSSCNMKTDAIRSLKITKLPTVFQLQIIRYTFNRTTLEKEKIQGVFNYPERVDLARLFGLEEENEYSIHAALMHSGTSAERGHYFCKVRDKASNIWHELSDERIEAENEETDCNGNIVQETAKDDPIEETCEMTTEKLKSSGDVCMLVYIKDGTNIPEPNESENLKREIILIKQEDDAYMQETKKQHDTACICQKHVNDLFTSLSTRDQFDVLDEHFISLKLIKRLIKGDLEFPVDANNDLLCPHAKVRPLLRPIDEAQVPYRVIPKLAAESLYQSLFKDIQPVLPVKDSICRDCVMIRCKQLKAESQIKEDYDIAKNRQKEFEKIYLPLLKTKTVPDDFLTGKYWMHNTFFRNWKAHAKNAVEEMTSLDFKKDISIEYRKNLICNPGQLSCPENDRKLIHGEVWEILFQKYFVSDLDFSAETLTSCRGCERAREKNAPVIKQNLSLINFYKEKIPNVLSGKNRPVLGQVGNFYLVSGTFITRVKNFVDNPNEANDPPVDIINDELRCHHGKLKFPIFKYESAENIDYLLVAAEDEKLTVLWEEEWNNLKFNLSFDTEIKVMVDQNRNILPPDCFCNECGEKWWKEAYEKLLNFEDKKILIKLKESGTPSNPKQAKTEQFIKVSGTLYNYDIETMIKTKFKVDRKNQSLRYNDILVDSSTVGNKMLKDFGILPGATISLEIIPTPQSAKGLEALRT